MPTEEFDAIPTGAMPTLDDLPPGSEDRNRYANVLPVPETRVVLEQKTGAPNSDYINANYVRVSTGRYMGRGTTSVRVPAARWEGRGCLEPGRGEDTESSEVLGTGDAVFSALVAVRLR